MPVVTAIIPNWNRRDQLEQVLRSLRRQTYPCAEVLVVDNGSTDASAEMAAAAGARVLQMGTNTGFSRAVNAGIKAASTPWLAIVNNDVELAPDWLEKLLQTTDSGEEWFAAGKLLKASDRELLDGTYDEICRGACGWRAGHGRPDGPEWGEPRPIRFASFTATLFRGGLFERVGLLDERFESYLEDVDFGLRCAREGCRGIYVPSAVAYHAGSATLGEWHPDKVRRISRNQLWLVAKHFPKGWPRRYGWHVLVAQSLWGLVALRNGAGWAFVKGKAEAIRSFGAVRAAAGGEGWNGIDAVLEESERELLGKQKQTGFDLYWRLYSALT